MINALPSEPTILVRAAALILLACFASAATAEDVVIAIRLVNGKNGKPIKDENLNIFRDQRHFAENIRADSNGVIKLTIDRNALVSFASNIQITCHRTTEAETSRHELQQYIISDIVEHGISDTNTCSKKIRIEAKPGEFVFYERPRTFWEWMAL
jgi:hypothetical protein